MPPSHRRTLVVASAALLLALSGGAHAATIVVGGGDLVEGSGNVVDDVRSVAPFTRVLIDGPIDVQLRHTGAEKVVVHADDNIASLIDARVEGGKLTVQTRKDASFRTRSRLSVRIEFKQLDALELDGSGDVDVDDLKAVIFEGSIRGPGSIKVGRLDAGTVAISIAGSGDFTAQGRADKAGFVVDGSGDVHAADLRAKAVAVSISGSGDARVCASDTLQVRIAGSGDVRYCGSPRIEKRVAGSGEVKPIR